MLEGLSKVNIYEVVTAQEESMLFQYHKQCHCFHSFLEFHTSESANNFTKAANVPVTCPAHVVHIHCPEGSKLMLKNNFLCIILLFSLCFEGSFAELQNGDKCTDSWWERKCEARRAVCGFFPPYFVVLNGGGCPGSFLLGTSGQICPWQQAALGVCTARTGTTAFLSINPWCRSILRELGVCSYSSAYPILCLRGAFQLEYSIS